MKFLILVLFITIGVEAETITTGLTTTVGTQKHKDAIGTVEESSTEASKMRVAKFAEKYGVGLVVNEDAVTDETNFIRPCGFDCNIKCVRNFLQENSKCKPAYGKIGEFYLAQNTEFFPFLNLTITCSDFTSVGLDNYKIKEFYYNKVTCKLVIAFEIKNLNETSPLVYFSYQRTAKESIVLADYVNVFTECMIITVIIPYVPNLCLEFGEAHAYLPDANPLIEIGPKAYTSEDPDVQNAYAALLKNIPIVLKERAYLKTDLLAALLIQETICDFGFKLYRL